jgi:lipoprotein signal peptidase
MSGWVAKKYLDTDIPSGKPMLAMGLTLFLGGALGNMLDRARIGL